jgi:hypothetical protein
MFKCNVLAAIRSFIWWRVVQKYVESSQLKRPAQKEQVVERIKELCGEEIPAGIFGKLVREMATPSATRQAWTAKAGFMGRGASEDA